MELGICVTKDNCTLNFPVKGGTMCILTFGYNTKFEYSIIGDMICIHRKNMDFTISQDTFKQLFRVIKQENYHG